MISPEKAEAAAMAAEAGLPDPAIMALAAKSLVFDLPRAVVAESMRFNVRLATIWLDHLGRVAALDRSTRSGSSARADGRPARMAPSPIDVAATLAA